MKKSAIILILLIQSFIIFSQPPNLKIEVLQRPYKDIENSITLCENNTPLLDTIFFQPPIEIFGNNYDKLDFIENEGSFIQLHNAISQKNDVYFPFLFFFYFSKIDPDQRDFSISYLLEKEVGERELTIQWKNIIPDNYVEVSDYLNMQIFIDEKNKIVEYRYGPISSKENLAISQFEYSLAYLIGFLFDIDDANTNDITLVRGDFLNPEIHTFLNIESPSDIPSSTLSSFPNEDMVYRFYLETSASKELFVNKNIILLNNNVFLKINKEDITSLQIHNFNGTLIKNYNTSEISDEEINIQELGSGLYFLTSFNRTGRLNIEKFIKI